MAPRQAARRLLAGGPGGIGDLGLLLLLRTLAVEGRQVVVGFLHVEDEGAGALLGVVYLLAQSVRKDLIGVLLGGIAFSLLCGSRERQLRPGLGVEMTAQAWIGWLCVQVVAALWFSRHEVGDGLRLVAQLSGLVIFGALWVLALLTTRAALAQKSM
jgi:hypothetical protein